MRSFTVHFVYLSPDALEARWTHLHRFLHPGSREHDQQALIVGADLDIAHHPYLSIRARDWEGTGGRILLLRHDLVDSILEIRSHTNQLGFVDLSAVREELKAEES